MVNWFSPDGSGICGGPCDGCNPCNGPLLLAETVSTSLTKCGISEFTGHVSTPPRLYLQSVYSHTGTASWNSGTGNYSNSSVSYTSTTTVTAPGCVSTTSTSGGSSSLLHQDGSDEPCNSPSDESCWAVFDGCGTICVEGMGADCTPTTTVTATEQSYSISTSGSQTTAGHTVTCSYTESITTTLSDEYTTAALIGYATAALPGFTGTFPSSSATASYDLSANQLTVSLSKAEYKFRFQPSTCYQINWIERFIGEDGEGDPLAPVDTAKSWTYAGGADPAGYNPADPTTWPESPVYTLPVPASNGETTVVNVTFSCTCGS